MSHWYGRPRIDPEGQPPQSTSYAAVTSTTSPTDTGSTAGRGEKGSLWVFAGQGSQQPHMGAGLSAAPALFERVHTAVGLDLAKVCTFEDTPRWDQPVVQAAILTIATASAQVCRSRGGRPGAVLGHSFGEYAALVVAKSLSFDDAIRLAVARGQAMADLADGSTAMAAVIGATNDAVAEVCEELQRSGVSIHVAAYNSPGQTVLAGTSKGLALAARRLRGVGATRTRTLSVPFAAHSPYMKAVQERLEPALERIHIDPPSVPYYSTVTGHRVKRPDELRDLLVRSVAEPVRFRETAIRALSESYDKVLEVGSDRPPRLLGFIGEICRCDLPERPTPCLCAVAADSDAPDGRPFAGGRPTSSLDIAAVEGTT
ncbi:ACP S-malonyltransferase [Streptomyces sp. NPDC060027]|uniref:ACP S-malonyltransferase n=1 Tax=Streptomyces sp. NPDC060027 TaxID=3347040 RepID=UPI003698DD84